MLTKFMLFIVIVSFVGCKNPFRGKRGHHGGQGEQGIQGEVGKSGVDGQDGAKGDQGELGESTYTLFIDADAHIKSSLESRINVEFVESGVLVMVVPEKLDVSFTPNDSGTKFHHFAYIDYGHIRLCYQGSNQFDRSLEFKFAIDDRVESECFKAVSSSHAARLNVMVDDVLKSSETSSEELRMRVTSNGKLGSTLVETEVSTELQIVKHL